MPTLALMLAFAAAVTLFDGLQVVGAMGLRAQGVVWLPTIIHVGSYIVVMLPLCVWLAFGPESVPGGLGLGVWGVFIGISVASVVAGVGQVLALELKSRDAERRAEIEGVAAVVLH
jgi:MATE family multidrug resistance protein